MVDFKKMLEEHKAKGKFLGYCSIDTCKWPNRIYEVDILPAYKDLPIEIQKAKCPHCNCYVMVNDLIPF